MGDDSGGYSPGGFFDLLTGTLDRVLQYERIKADAELAQKPIYGDTAPWYSRDNGGIVQSGKSSPASVSGVPSWVIGLGLGAAALVAVALLLRR